MITARCRSDGGTAQVRVRAGLTEAELRMVIRAAIGRLQSPLHFGGRMPQPEQAAARQRARGAEGARAQAPVQ